MARYLGIDFGEKRIGLAVSDPTLTIAQPYKTLIFVSLKNLILDIKKLIQDLEIEKVILGLPLTMKGTDSQKTQVVRDFGSKLMENLDIPVIFFDERLSSVQAHSVLRQLGKKPSKNRPQVDQLAAQHILQAYLDREKKAAQ